MQELFVESSGGRVGVVDFGGEGPDLLVLHGMCGSALDWLAFSHVLTTAYRVVAIDLRSHGQTVGPYDIEGQLDDIESVIDVLSLEAPVLMGHSRGGFLAVVFASCRRGVSCVVNLDGHMGWSEVRELAGLPQEDPRAARAELEPYAFAGTLAELDEVVRREGLDGDPSEAVLRRRFLDDGEGRVRLRPTPAEYEQLVAADALVLAEGLRRQLSVATLVLIASDPEGPEADGKRAQASLFARLPSVELQVIEGGHFLHDERPREVFQRMQAFTTRS